MSLRTRLALLYLGVLALLLFLVGLSVRTAVEQQLQANVDSTVVQPAREVAGELQAQKGVPVFQRSVYLPLVRTFKDPGVYVQLDRPSGRWFAKSPTLQEDQLPAPRGPISPNGAFRDVQLNGGSVRLYTLPLTSRRNVLGFVQVGKSLEDETVALRDLTTVIVIVSLVALALSSLASWLIATSALRPLSVMTRSARSIARTRSFGQRLPAHPNTDEVGTMGAAFNEVLSSLDQAHSAQQRFLADASHELRTPLTGLEADLDFLAMAPDAPPDERHEAFSSARRAVKRMGRLVGELLYLARAEAGQELKLQPIELDGVVVQAYKEIKPIATGLSTELASIVEARVLGDPGRLEQVFLILLDNAVKYTPAGGSVRMAMSVQDGWVRVSIQDTGIGIAKAEEERIFERFYRSSIATTHAADGSGLGLAIAEQIVSTHRGRIDVESTPGVGSTFAVSMPIYSG